MNITVDVVGNVSQSLLGTVGLVVFLVLTIYDYVMLFFGIFGNVLILYATIQYNAISLDRVSLIFVKNIAVVDIVWTMLTTFTICVSNTCSNTWCMGGTMCTAVAYLRHPCAATEIMLVCFVSSHRVYTIWMALRAETFTRRHAYGLTTTAWVIPLSVLAVSVIYSIDVEFVPLLSTCVLMIIHEPRAKNAAMLLTLFLVILPFLVTILSNICMLYYSIKLSRRHRNASFKGALITVFAICGTFTITALPNIVRLLLPPMGKSSPVPLEILNGHIYIINASCNSIILTITNRKFRTFFFRRFLRCCYSQDKDDSLFMPNSTLRSAHGRLIARNSASVPIFPTTKLKGEETRSANGAASRSITSSLSHSHSNTNTSTTSIRNISNSVSGRCNPINCSSIPEN